MSFVILIRFALFMRVYLLFFLVVLIYIFILLFCLNLLYLMQGLNHVLLCCGVRVGDVTLASSNLFVIFSWFSLMFVCFLCPQVFCLILNVVCVFR